MDIRKVKKLIELLEESGVAEIEIHEGEESVRISRGQSLPVAPQTTLIQTPASTSTPQSTSPGDTLPDDGPQQEPAPVGDIVKSPMVGIFYESPAPGKAPFVQLGQSVKAGDVLCIIEAMKIMNQVESEFSGTVSKIMIENGEPVEYGQPLFLIREE